MATHTIITHNLTNTNFTISTHTRHKLSNCYRNLTSHDTEQFSSLQSIRIRHYVFIDWF